MGRTPVDLLLLGLAACTSVELRPVTLPAADVRLRGVVWSGPKVFAAASRGGVLELDAGWVEWSGLGLPGAMHDVWATAWDWRQDQDVIVVGDGGAVVHSHFDTDEYERSWRLVESGTDRTLRAVEGVSPDDLTVVGDVGTILHFDGRALQRRAAPTEANLFGASRTHVVGAGGVLLERQGDTWRRVSSGTQSDLFAVDGDWIVGAAGTVLRRQDGQWQRVDSGVDANLYAVAAHGAEAFAAGAGGVLLSFDGASWQREEAGTQDDLYGVAVTAGIVVVAGDHGTLRRYRWHGWHGELFAGPMNGVWAASADDAWAVGEPGLFRLSGGAWRQELSEPLLTVAGRGATATVAAGIGGRVVRLENGAWRPLAPVFNEDLWSVWESATGQVWAMNPVLTTFRLAGNDWVLDNTPVLGGVAERCTPARLIWLAPQGTARADCGLRFAGEQWSVASDAGTAPALRLAGRDLELGDAVRIDGVDQWDHLLHHVLRLPDSPGDTPPSLELHGAWSDGETLFVAGSLGRQAGFVLRHGRRRLWSVGWDR